MHWFQVQKVLCKHYTFLAHFDSTDASCLYAYLTSVKGWIIDTTGSNQAFPSNNV